jgi:hypothetical protein
VYTTHAIPYEDDVNCLAAALRAACLASHTSTTAAAFVLLDVPEPTWTVAADLAGVTLLNPGEPSDRLVVGAIADACASGPGRTRALCVAAGQSDSILVLDAPGSVFDADAVDAFVADGAALVAVTQGAGRHPWSARLAGSPQLLRAVSSPFGAVA